MSGVSQLGGCSGPSHGRIAHKYIPLNKAESTSTPRACVCECVCVCGGGFNGRCLERKGESGRNGSAYPGPVSPLQEERLRRSPFII